MALVDLSGAVQRRQIFSPSITFAPGTYLTIEEDPSDDAVITQHPVDSGAVMSDHIYLQPPELKLRLGWSNADPAATGPTYVQDIYKQLLQLKNNRQLFTVFTGKRLYNNMFVASLRGPLTNPQYEWSMVVELLLRQVLLVSLNGGNAAPTVVNAAANQAPQNNASPQVTQPTANTGAAQPTVASVNPDTVSGLNSPTVDLSGLGATNNNNGGAASTLDFDF